MITVETLRAWGANVDEALERCLGNEAFYLRLTEKALQDPSFDRLTLEEAILEIEACDQRLDRLYESAGVERRYKPFRFPCSCDRFQSLNFHIILVS